LIDDSFNLDHLYGAKLRRIINYFIKNSVFLHRDNE